MQAQLGLVVAILSRIQERAKKVIEDIQQALEPVLELCKAKAAKLIKLFLKLFG